MKVENRKIGFECEHAGLMHWIDSMVRMCKPDRLELITGSEEQKQRLIKEAKSKGEIVLLDQDKLPGCMYHRTSVDDVARTEELTFICTARMIDAGPTNNWMSPDEGYRRAGEIFKNSMKGRTMYVVPFSMGPVGSPFSKTGVELTDSIYVVLNMYIMARVGSEVLDHLGADGEFTRCLHGIADRSIRKRLILHFPNDNTIWSVGSGYGGNVLLGKKSLALRIASFIARKEGWLAEHMLIMGVEEPSGRISYVSGAFPSACGKTNLAMLKPPEGLRDKGYRIWTVSDDIAWMRIDTDGTLWGINPETGVFGVVPGTNSRTNPNAMRMIGRNTIYTNTLLKLDGTVWWEDGDDPPPPEGIDWRGVPWKPGMTDDDGNPIRGAHPNSRFTAPISQCPTASFRLDQPHGVPISAVLFGGRRARLTPLVFEAFDWAHGVYVGATMRSERTAAQAGEVGEVRWDPMAMIPFCGYNMADYFDQWLLIGRKLERQPKIFHVNWFRQDEHGDYLWPGFGENLRVIEWILARARNEVDAVETPIGYVPRPEDIDMTGLDLSDETMRKLLEADVEAWLEEIEAHEENLKRFGRRLPEELWHQFEKQKERLRSAK